MTSSLGPIIEELEICFSRLNQHFYGGQLEKPIISVAKNPTKRSILGYCTYMPVWKDTDENSSNKGSYEILICADALHMSKLGVFEILLHEMVHLYCAQNGIRDTSQNGTYHNRRYREVAEAHGLLVDRDDFGNTGWSDTSLNEEAMAFLNCFPRDKDKFEIYRLDNIRNTSSQSRKRKPKYKFECFGGCGECIEVNHRIHVICARCKQELIWVNPEDFDELE